MRWRRRRSLHASLPPVPLAPCTRCTLTSASTCSPAACACARARTTLAPRRRRGIDTHAVIRVGVDDVLVADAVAVLVDPSDRLLEEAGLRHALPHRAFEDV